MNILKYYRVNDPYVSFSNFAPFPIFINGKLWKTVEHYFQANKFSNLDIIEKISNYSSPMDAVKEGRNRFNIIKSDWEEIKDDVMYKGLYFKFIQHPKLTKELLSTGNTMIIEHTKNDKYWADGGDGSRKNRLGELLIVLREEIKNLIDSEIDLILPPWIAFPNIDQNDLFWRMGMGENYLSIWAKYYLNTNKNFYEKRYPENEDWEGVYSW
ncbi:NADAR family protein [Empedobacter brevis]|uniref:NADAR family protein n=1 Tax=Empedobacter brevis TaxID=247 RepID=A0AAJ1QDF2_9FLAO|nr:NADAR family protein [Empedobacter brevis]MDM1072008.1 NADAR family protein [Empedobacter brevis]